MKAKLQAFSKRHKFSLQLIAFALAVLAPFGIYFALAAGLAWLAALAFALFALGMLLTFWAG